MKNDSTRRVRSPTARWTPMPSLRSPARRRNQRPSPSSSASTPASATNASTAATAPARTASGSGRRFMTVRLPLGRPRVRRAMTAIRVDGLRKAYGATEAVAGISFEVVEGECFALLGPNGAGKTTTLEILEGYRDRSGGSVEVLGVDPAHGGRDLRERIGIVLQSAGIDRELTVAEVVALFGGYYPHPRDPGEVIELVGLGDKRDARCRTLSGGQQRRLDLALGIVGDPDLIFLDEPTTGFDPSARPSCSPPTTWTRPRTWPTGWPSWPLAGSWPPAARPRSAAATWPRPRSASGSPPAPAWTSCHPSARPGRGWTTAGWSCAPTPRPAPSTP